MLRKHHPTTNQFDYANVTPFKNVFAQQQQNGEMIMKKKH